MKAVRIHSHGGTEVLRYEEVPDPAYKPTEVLVRVRACSLNHLDLWIRRGLPGITYAFPHILGSDISGEVVAAGDACERIRPGQRVLLAPALSCRQCIHCVSGQDNRCRGYRLFGNGTQGGNREMMPAPEYAVLPIPDDLSFEEAAAAPLVFLTAWHMLMAKAKLHPGEDVLVLSASSGVGSAAIQIAKLFQCRVIATAGSAEKMAKARELGADEVIDHYTQDIAAEVKRLTGKRGVDVVFEHVGAATWPKSVGALAADGRLVTCGATTGYDVGVDLRFLFSRRLSLLGSYMGTLGDLHRVMQFIFRKKLRPIVDRTYPLSEAAAAHERLEKKEQFGKILLLP